MFSLKKKKTEKDCFKSLKVFLHIFKVNTLIIFMDIKVFHVKHSPVNGHHSCRSCELSARVAAQYSPGRALILRLCTAHHYLGNFPRLRSGLHAYGLIKTCLINTLGSVLSLWQLCMDWPKDADLRTRMPISSCALKTVQNTERQASPWPKPSLTIGNLFWNPKE